MTTSKALNGFRPLRMRGSGAYSGGMSEYRIASATNVNIFTGDLVCTSLGFIRPHAAVTEKITGVFMGCNYEQDGEPKWSRHWPSGTSASNIRAMVVDDPRATFAVQADASVSLGDLYDINFDVTLGAGSTTTGKSGFGLEATTRATTQKALRIVGLIDAPGNDIDVAAERAFLQVEVRINEHIDAYISAGTSTVV